ncbi:transporter substrate-binding domain-containing protein [Spiribacter sp. 221]|uniref:substrate-binding periplasmic protein n=1 Tax=Spiribacter onubensis TaxID=3122420 RepID=UPI00349F9DA6
MRSFSALSIPLTILLAFAATTTSANDYPTQYPFPDSRLQTGPELRFCIDKRDPTWRAQQAIAEEIALSVGRPATFFVTREEDERGGYQMASTRKEFLVRLATQCDAYMGLPGSTTAAFDYPADEEMLASQPFFRTGFQLVSRDPSVESLTDLSPDDQLGLQGRGVPYLLLMTTRPDSVQVKRYRSSDAIVSALRAGEVDHAVVYAPQLYGEMADPESEGFGVHPVTSLPNMEWYVFAGLRSDRPTLRQKFDRAIARMLESGRMGEILADNGLPAGAFKPAAADAVIPDDDFGDDDDDDDEGSA